jgi:hypothetical protein
MVVMNDKCAHGRHAGARHGASGAGGVLVLPHTSRLNGDLSPIGITPPEPATTSLRRARTPRRSSTRSSCLRSAQLRRAPPSRRSGHWPAALSCHGAEARPGQQLGRYGRTPVAAEADLSDRRGARHVGTGDHRFGYRRHGQARPEHLPSMQSRPRVPRPSPRCRSATACALTCAARVLPPSRPGVRGEGSAA